MSDPQTALTLVERVPHTLPDAALPSEVEQHLQRAYHAQISLTHNRLTAESTLTNLGWVGHIPLSADFTIRLQAKVSAVNLFAMLVYAFDLRFLDGLSECDTFAEFCAALAQDLAGRILRRGRQGLQQPHRPRHEWLSVVRGRIDIPQAVRQVNPTVKLPCRYTESTVDVFDNQLLLWTLHLILRSRICRGESHTAVQQAFLSLRRVVSLTPFQANDCWQRLQQPYPRPIKDYRPLHTLCYFFLTMSQPSSCVGSTSMLPFLVNMERLYERFVAAWLTEWLKQHRPDLRLKQQARVDLSDHAFFKIDLVLQRVSDGQALCVLDTKYKVADKVSSEDIQQVIAYAEAQGCREAILIYPTTPPQTVISVGEKRVRCLTFALTGDLHEAGQTFVAGLESLLKNPDYLGETTLSDKLG